LAGPSGKFITGEVLTIDGGQQMWGGLGPLVDQIISVSLSSACGPVGTSQLMGLRRHHGLPRRSSGTRSFDHTPRSLPQASTCSCGNTFSTSQRNRASKPA
jgi:hypothetical protein